MLGFDFQRWKFSVRLGLIQVLHGCRQLVSWDVGLSPATSATPVISCHRFGQYSGETAGDKPEEGGGYVKSHGPYGPGYTRATMVSTWARKGDLEQISKRYPSSDCTLQLGYEVGMLVIADQHAAVNTFGSCTHRPSHHGSWFTLSRWVNLRETADHGKVSDWGEA